MRPFRLLTLACGLIACSVVGNQRCAAENVAAGSQPLVIENDCLGVQFDPHTGGITCLTNKLTGEKYPLTTDEFELDASPTPVRQRAAKLVSLDLQPQQATAVYQHGDIEIHTTYVLSGHFVEKRLSITFPTACELKHLVISRPTIASSDLQFVPYRYPKYQRKPGDEPSCTFFGRTARGGLFVGVGMPFDASTLSKESITLVYAPSLRFKAGEKYRSEPAYFGVYKRQANEAVEPGIPLRSESDAMVQMTSAVLGPPRHGLVAMNCGWHSEMAQEAFQSVEDLEANMRSLDFLAECGIDWSTESHPWGGETKKMNALVDDQKYVLDDYNKRFLEHAKQKGIKIVQWPTFNNTHPWSRMGKAFRPDRPDWLMTIDRDRYKNTPDISQRGNCLAIAEFEQWLERRIFDALDTGYYVATGIDGDFFGGGGWFTTTIPVTCTAANHDHLPGDSNYACQRTLARLVAALRERYPKLHIEAARPPMDLGVWSLHNFDVCFTLLEEGNTPSNLKDGDKIRTWSRTRVQRDFLPHYFDQPLLFPTRSGKENAPSTWSGDHLDYILLSGLSCSAEIMFYLPTRTGIPDADKATLRRRLDWGRENIKYLHVRKDLPDWPAGGKVDGSAHIIDDSGLVFLFNGGEQPLDGSFSLSEESIGLTRGERFKIRQQFPASDREVLAERGAKVSWTVPKETAMVLQILPQ